MKRWVIIPAVRGEDLRFQLVDSKRWASNGPEPSKDYPRGGGRKDRCDDDYQAVPLMFKGNFVPGDVTDEDGGENDYDLLGPLDPS